MNKFSFGQRVKRMIDPSNKAHGYKYGTIFTVYSKPKISLADGSTFDPYPELYSVHWDDDTIKPGYLPHGLEHAEWEVGGGN